MKFLKLTKTMKIIVRENLFMLIMLMLTIIMSSSSVFGAELEIKDSIISIGNSRFNFECPKGWMSMDKSQSANLKKSGFAGGFSEKVPSSCTPPYFLIKLTDHTLTPQKKKAIIKYTNKLEDYSLIQSYFEDNTSSDKLEYYDNKTETFIFLVKYRDSKWPNKSIMLKKFDNQGAILIHFYCGENIKEDIITVKGLANSFN